MPTTVYVCRKCKGNRALLAELERHDGVRAEPVGCQDICKGAVAGLNVKGTMTWFRRLRGPKDRRAFAKLAAKGGKKVRKRLAGHVVTRRSGRSPKP